MITVDLVMAMALRHERAMEQLGSALRSDLVLADPFKRRIVEFADDFVLKRRKLPSEGDYAVWLDTLEPGVRDGTREALSRVLAISVEGYDPEYFAEASLPILKQAATMVALARANAVSVGSEPPPDMFAKLAEKIDALSVTAAARRSLWPTLGELITGKYAREDNDDALELIPRLAWRGRHVLLAATAKLGKSTYLAAGVAALTRGWRFLDGFAGTYEMYEAGDSDSVAPPPQERRPGRVLWLAMDEAHGDAYPRLIDNGAFPTRIAVINPPDPARMLARVLVDEEQRPDLLVVDSLIVYAQRSAKEPPASGDATAWAQVVRPLTDFAHTLGLGIVTIHHSRKSDGKYRDSGEIAAAVDAVIEMHEPRGSDEETVRHIRMVGRRSIATRGARYAIRLTQEDIQTPLPGGTVTVKRDVFQLGAADNAAEQPDTGPNISEQMRTFVAAHPGCRQQAIFQMVGQRKAELDSLVRAGTLREEKQGKGYAYFVVEVVEVVEGNAGQVSEKPES